MSKGQALEFLTTYGWVLLVILVMIAALAYFGVLNPTQFLPAQIIESRDCKDWSLENNIEHIDCDGAWILNNEGCCEYKCQEGGEVVG